MQNRQSIRMKGYDYTQPGYYFVTIVTYKRKQRFGRIYDGKMHLNEIGKMVVDAWYAIPEHFPKVVLDAFVVMPDHVHGIIQILDHPTHSPEEDTLQILDSEQTSTTGEQQRQRAQQRSGQERSLGSSGQEQSLGSSGQEQSLGSSGQERRLESTGERSFAITHAHAALPSDPEELWGQLLPRDDHATRPLGTSRTLGSIVRGFKIGVTKPFRKLPGNEGVKLWHRNYYEIIIRDQRALFNIRRYIHNNPLNWTKSRLRKKR